MQKREESDLPNEDKPDEVKCHESVGSSENELTLKEIQRNKSWSKRMNRQKRYGAN